MFKRGKQQRFLAIAIALLLLLTGSFILVKQFSEEKSYFEYTKEDVKLLANLIHAELMYSAESGYFSLSLENADQEDLKLCYMLIGSVVLHRLESRMFGETMRDVIYAPGQFSTVWIYDIMTNIDTPPEVYEWVEELLKFGPKGPEGLIYAYCFKMSDNLEPYQEVCGMYFYVGEGITKKVEGGKVN